MPAWGLFNSLGECACATYYSIRAQTLWSDILTCGFMSNRIDNSEDDVFLNLM